MEGTYRVPASLSEGVVDVVRVKGSATTRDELVETLTAQAVSFFKVPAHDIDLGPVNADAMLVHTGTGAVELWEGSAEARCPRPAPST